MSVLEQFLATISTFLRTRDDRQLQLYLRIEPPLPDEYTKLSQELKTSYRDGDALEVHIEKLIPYNEDESPEEGGPWPGFLAFMKSYLEYWRDVNFEDLLETYSQLSAVLNACITAFSHNMHGLMLLPTTLQLSAALARLATMLDKRPDLTSHLQVRVNYEAGEMTRKTLVEGTAECIQRAFTICLTERGASSNGIGPDGKPEGKKVGIYSFANLVLKLLFQCRKTSVATQLFTNIIQQSPQLARYPASQRVTYLYYLGRFQFYNTHFFSAALALQSAYDQCHAKCIEQRRNILVFLTAANIILGKFPSAKLCSRPEAAGALERFMPICRAIKMGDFITFKHLMSREGGNFDWMWVRKIYLPILSRCEMGVWRSLARRVFLLTYEEPTDPNSKKAPTLDINHLVTAAQYCQKVLEGWEVPPGKKYLRKPKTGRIELRAFGGVIFGNYMPDLLNVECTVACLVEQGFLHGFVSHNQAKFAIIGAKTRGGAFNAGFPPFFEVIRARAESQGRHDSVPAWIQEDRVIGGGGRVVKLTTAKPVGM